MVPRKRQKLDIICDMLTSIQAKGGEIKPTHLMYKANLAHRQLKTYLDDLLENELIEKISRKNNEYIIITDRGLKFISKIKELKNFEGLFGF